MPKKLILFSVLAMGLATSVGVVSNMSAAAKYEEPQFRVLKKDGQFEVRGYPGRLVAEVTVDGDRSTAMNKGFQILAGYIFGSNKPGVKLPMTAPMTAPVTASSGDGGGEKIPMTAPVAVQEKGQRWQITFFMPSNYRLETLPEPKDKRIVIRQMPPKEYAVLRFSGNWRSSNLEDNEKKLLARVTRDGLKTDGETVLAFYNPPFTLPFMRRNEVMVPVIVDEDHLN